MADQGHEVEMSLERCKECGALLDPEEVVKEIVEKVVDVGSKSSSGLILLIDKKRLGIAIKEGLGLK